MREARPTRRWHFRTAFRGSASRDLLRSKAVVVNGGGKGLGSRSGQVTARKRNESKSPLLMNKMRPFVHAFPPMGTVAAPFRDRCGSPPSPVLWASNRSGIYPGAFGFPPMVRRRWRALLGSWKIPLETCPKLGTQAIPARSRTSGRPDAAFRLTDSVGAT